MGSLRPEQGLFSLGMPISHETILRVRSRMPWMSDPAEEQISHSEEDHGFGDVGVARNRGLRRRYRVSQPILRSTAHRRGMTLDHEVEESRLIK